NTKFDGMNARSWVLQIARNQIIDTVRSSKPTQTGVELAAAAACDTDDELLEERTQALRNCLGGISPELSSVIRLRLNGKAYDQIAAELQIPLGTAHSRFSKAKD